MSFWPALLLSLAFCVVLGLALHFLIFRPLRHAPPLAKVVASVGLLVYLQAVVIRRYALTAKQIVPLPYVKNSTKVNLIFFKINQDKLFVAVVVLVLTAILWAVFKWTRFGLATRAAAENEKGAVVLGFSPDFLAGTNWVLSTLITGMLGIFVASVLSQIEPIALPALIVPAVIAALVGGFSSFWLTTAAAFVLGMQAPLVTYFARIQTWIPRSGRGPFPGVCASCRSLLSWCCCTSPATRCPSAARSPRAASPSHRHRRQWALRIGGPVLILLTAVADLFWLSPEYRIGAVDHADRRHHLPLARRADGVRRPDLAGADGIRGHLRVLGVAPHDPNTAGRSRCRSSWARPWLQSSGYSSRSQPCASAA